ncbi:A24 family peptidase [Sphingobium sufflavum]|uniref:prepilin peptidase n=1 Tax=Sphingobium sufflavum TaxID=1129547 RepID=UPI001F3EEA57|nr:A24 family peptidase [Sphingobium sufflavum]MCE7797495.1 A24 family peptidase [Sphingobium sufflavum]
MLVGAGIGVGLGLILGSFLGALVTRWPTGRSVAAGRSCCDTCGVALRPRDLVPVLSALLAGLRCRSCGARIDPVHMAMEVGAAAIGAIGFAFAPDTLAATAWCLLGWGLLTLALLDARHFWLPDALTLPLAFLGFVVGPYATDVAMPDRGIGAAAGYGVLMAVSLAYRAMRGREGLGWGDAKLLGAIGAWAGWQALPFLLLVASLAGLGWAGWLAVRYGGVERDRRLPLGTMLCLATGPALWGETMLLAA